MNVSCIYRIINKINNKIYIGSAVNFRIRRHTHLRLLRNNQHDNIHLQNSFNKYGEDNFEFEILQEVDNKTYPRYAEQDWIDLCRLEGVELYNICFNAWTVLGIKKTMSKEWSKQKSNSMIGNQYALGYQHTQATKTKISQFNTGKPNYNSRKPVAQIDLVTGEIIKHWNSAIEAAKELNINKCSISSTCKGRYKSAGGFHWQLI